MVDWSSSVLMSTSVSLFIVLIVASAMADRTATDSTHRRLQLRPRSHLRQPSADVSLHRSWRHALYARRTRLELPYRLLLLLHHAQHAGVLKLEKSEVKVTPSSSRSAPSDSAIMYPGRAACKPIRRSRWSSARCTSSLVSHYWPCALI